MTRSSYHDIRLKAIENELRYLSKHHQEYTDDEIVKLNELADSIAEIRIPITIVEHK